VRTIAATELARNLRRVLDRLAIEGEEIVIERNREQVARLLPGPARQTALEAMADLYRTLPEDATATWVADSRRGRWKGSRLDKGIRDPWASSRPLARQPGTTT
jgi:antitoxin (DNA-binding transcriptional repressor) of toxin-antitoxin stability system